MKKRAEEGPLPIKTEFTPEYNDEKRRERWRISPRRRSWRRVLIVSIGYRKTSTAKPDKDPHWRRSINGDEQRRGDQHVQQGIVEWFPYYSFHCVDSEEEKKIWKDETVLIGRSDWPMRIEFIFLWLSESFVWKCRANETSRFLCNPITPGKILSWACGRYLSLDD